MSVDIPIIEPERLLNTYYIKYRVKPGWHYKDLKIILPHWYLPGIQFKITKCPEDDTYILTAKSYYSFIFKHCLFDEYYIEDGTIEKSIEENIHVLHDKMNNCHEDPRILDYKNIIGSTYNMEYRHPDDCFVIFVLDIKDLGVFLTNIFIDTPHNRCKFNKYQILQKGRKKLMYVVDMRCDCVERGGESGGCLFLEFNQLLEGVCIILEKWVYYNYK